MVAVKAAGVAAVVAMGMDRMVPLVALAAGTDSVAAQRFPHRLTVSRLWTKEGREVWPAAREGAFAPTAMTDGLS